MNLKICLERASSYKAHRKPATEPKATGEAAATSPFRMALSDHSKDQRIQALRGKKIAPVPPPAKNGSTWSLGGLLGRAFSSLRERTSAPRRLLLAEIVSLGEKRFVAIVHAEGHSFLIGGAASSVNLLTRLDEIPPRGRSLQSFVSLAGESE